MPERERLEVELHCARIEWAADGGDGSVCSTSEPDDVRTCNLEMQLHGALLEAMAAVVLRPEPARVSSGVESESSMGVPV